MGRRAVIAALGSLALSGCVNDASERGNETELDTTTEECGWPAFCEGSKIMEVTVSSSFSGAVVLEAECRDGDFVIRPGESKTTERQADAETCDVVLYVDGREAYNDTVQNYESTTLTIDSSGEVDAETVEL